jgi:hypothetical protein
MYPMNYRELDYKVMPYFFQMGGVMEHPCNGLMVMRDGRKSLLYFLDGNPFVYPSRQGETREEFRERVIREYKRKFVYATWQDNVLEIPAPPVHSKYVWDKARAKFMLNSLRYLLKSTLVHAHSEEKGEADYQRISKVVPWLDFKKITWRLRPDMYLDSPITFDYPFTFDASAAALRRPNPLSRLLKQKTIERVELLQDMMNLFNVDYDKEKVAKKLFTLKMDKVLP